MTSVLQPVHRAKAYKLAAEQIRERIDDGAWRPGERIPSEKELAAQLGISRGSVREALRMLEALGCVEIRPGGGTVVKGRCTDRPGAAMPQTVPPRTVELGDLWEARKIIEPRAAYLAAERCKDAELRAIRDNLRLAERLIKEGDWVQAVHLNPDFHLAVTVASGNKVLCDVQVVLAQLERAAVVSEGEPDCTSERAQKALGEHRIIFEAIRANAPEKAEQAMCNHLLDSWTAKWGG